MWNNWCLFCLGAIAIAVVTSIVWLNREERKREEEAIRVQAEKMRKRKATGKKTFQKCPVCQKEMRICWIDTDPVTLCCSDEQCAGTKQITEHRYPRIKTYVRCSCGSHMRIIIPKQRRPRWSDRPSDTPFLSCSDYPNCTNYRRLRLG